jgi:hypothetical protein
MDPAEQSIRDRYCPLTRQPCEQGDCSRCTRFWDCIAEAAAGEGEYASCREHNEATQSNENREERRE